MRSRSHLLQAIGLLHAQADNSAMTDRDYSLGTHDAEIARLGLQHRIWRPRTLAAWRAAGITVGQTVIDIGAGPGYAALDLAEIVGAQGQVVAVERSRRFLDALTMAAQARGLTNVHCVEQDVTELTLANVAADAAWCRWVLSFVSQPESVVRRLRSVLKTGAPVVFMEYAHYGSWRFAPASAAHDDFVEAVMQHWRADGGEPDVALELPTWLERNGFEIVRMQPHVEAVRPGDYFWEWPRAFIETGAANMVARGRLAPESAGKLADEMAAAANHRGTYMLTPLVLEVVARAR